LGEEKNSSDEGSDKEEQVNVKKSKSNESGKNSDIMDTNERGNQPSWTEVECLTLAGIERSEVKETVEHLHDKGVHWQANEFNFSEARKTIYIEMTAEKLNRVMKFLEDHYIGKGVLARGRTNKEDNEEGEKGHTLSLCCPANYQYNREQGPD